MKRNLITRGILTASMLLASIVSQADDFNLYYEATGSSTPVKAEAAANISKIIFEEGNIKIINNDGSTNQLPSANLSRLFFSTDNTVTEIEDTKDEGGKAANTPVLDLTGRAVSTSGDISNLPQGVYIVNGKKIIK